MKLLWEPAEDRRVLAAILGAVLVVTFAFSLVKVHRRDGLSSPPRPGDAIPYDCIAYHVARGDGFAINYADAEFARPYPTIATGPITAGARGPTTTRPPLFPLATAVVYRLAGRRFEYVRVLNCLAFSLAIALASLVAYRAGGIVAVCGVLACVVYLDAARPYLMGEMTTEAFATLACVVLFLVTRRGNAVIDAVYVRRDVSTPWV